MRKIRLPNSPIEILRYSGLTQFPNVIHFVTTRRGGVSEGNYASLNLGLYTDDQPERLRENFARLAAGLNFPTTGLLLPRQVHGCRIAVIDKTWLSLSDEEKRLRLDGIDALVTDVPEICVAVATADCVPLLLYAPDRQVVAAIHAGWRGTVQRITERTARLMIEHWNCDPNRLWAAIGPSISQQAFEVGEEVIEAFQETGFEMPYLLTRDSVNGKGHIDLWEANRLQLLSAGLAHDRIEEARVCTYASADDFFSARRLGIQSGRFLSGLYIKE